MPFYLNLSDLALNGPFICGSAPEKGWEQAET